MRILIVDRHVRKWVFLYSAGKNVNNYKPFGNGFGDICQIL